MTTVVVTGATGGIGGAIVERLLEDGWDVVPVGSAEGEVCGIPVRPLDVRDERAVEALFGGLRDADLGGVVNAAGVNRRSAALECSKETFLENLEVNRAGTFLVCREAAKLMSGRGGSIVNVASVVAFAGTDRQQVAYAASKGGVVALTYGLAVEWAGLGSRVNAIAPAFVDTPMNAVVARDPEKSAMVKAAIPLGRFGTATDMANAAAWLLSDQSSFITGDVLRVDGGYLAR